MKSFKALKQIHQEVRKEISEEKANVNMAVSFAISVFLFFNQFGEK